MVMPLRMLGMWIGQAQRATASGERIFEVMDEPEEVADRPGAIELPPGPGRVEYRGVGFEYAPGRPVLHGIDLELEPGSTTALIGHTGAGKTTLAALVGALLRRERRRRAARRRRRARRDARARCGARSASSRRIRSSSPRPCARTSRSASATRPTRRSSAPPSSRRRTSSSSGCRTATTR